VSESENCHRQSLSRANDPVFKSSTGQPISLKKEIDMASQEMSRRTLLKGTGAAMTGMALLNSGWLAQAASAQAEGEVLPWLDQPSENLDPVGIMSQLQWEELDSWITPNDQFFSISHYNRPEINAEDWQLEISGLVENPLTLTLDDLKAWPRLELDFTIECSGNHGLPFFWGGIGNARWAGVSLASLLDEAGVMDEGREVAFWGADAGEETLWEQTVTQNFARSMSIEDAKSPYNMLCYEMNGEDLPQPNGYPLRLIAPGWYGIANVKWLTRIEVRSSRLMNRFMARDYVTLRQEEVDGELVWTESSVGRSRIKSAPARVVSSDSGYRIEGAAWGVPIQSVEVKIDDGEWQSAELDTENVGRFAWRFWTLEWPDAEAGEHTITSRATDKLGNVQPAPDDPWLATKITYWESNGQITRTVEIPA
jgi:DMSO/TMAO reductase YedYZ molybdopterin-dependent catalytic subunit